MSAKISLVLAGQKRDLGDGFFVSRVLPHHKNKMVGPFIFLDEMGPAEFTPGTGIDVRPHPHIGLATVTYLFEGAIIHRDSLGVVQEIHPGDLNWMTAGRGIVHSERTPDRERQTGQLLHGLQLWCALPVDKEQIDPAFQHIPEQDLPQWQAGGVDYRLIAGQAYGKTSPVKLESNLFYLHARLSAESNLAFGKNDQERGIYVVSGCIQSDSTQISAGELAIFDKGAPIEIHSEPKTHLVLLGGEGLEGERKIWWNFVSSNPGRIQQAKNDWKNKRFVAVPGEHESTPLPES